ncbi:uncharacterized protein G6M90_00g055160 [Metarhizium brunneum]|uniref:beta-glucosidase n=1 Tax=Metarhizium brunneum TaxID=500148 RepID=A0A7D5YS82_9HYPO|nr:hypothetical protein G6M90_00g055160 [Metarhizium brunneum]
MDIPRIAHGRPGALGKAVIFGLQENQTPIRSRGALFDAADSGAITLTSYTSSLGQFLSDACIVFGSPGIRLVDGFIDHLNATAILFIHLPGQQSGMALVFLLWGQSNPSDKLPYTVAKRESDYGSPQFYFEWEQSTPEQLYAGNLHKLQIF